jgi:hypothetical protein
MYKWQTPVYDRVVGDIVSLKNSTNNIRDIGWNNLTKSQQQNWLCGDKLSLNASDYTLVSSDNLKFTVGNGIIKGAVNTYDLNRIQNNIRYIAQELILNSNQVILSDTNTYWFRTKYLYKENLIVLKNDIDYLWTFFTKPTGVPEIVISETLDYVMMNNIEFNLESMNQLLI